MMPQRQELVLEQFLSRQATVPLLETFTVRSFLTGTGMAAFRLPRPLCILTGGSCSTCAGLFRASGVARRRRPRARCPTGGIAAFRLLRQFFMVFPMIFTKTAQGPAAHFTLHTLHLTHPALNSRLNTPHFTLHTLHSPLHTPHLTFPTLHSTLYIPHFTLHTLHSTLYTPHFTLHTLHPTL